MERPFASSENPAETGKTPLDRDDMTSRQNSAPSDSEPGAYSDTRHRDQDPGHAEPNEGKFLAG